MAIHKVNKPWGSFEQFALNEVCTVKILTIVHGGFLSRQYHEKRDELWIILDEGITVEVDGRIFVPKVGEHVVIPVKAVHRASSERGGRILEVSTGFFDEDDIVRLDDVYGRA